MATDAWGIADHTLSKFKKETDGIMKRSIGSKVLSVILVLAMAAVWLPAGVASAAVSGDFEYTVSESEVTITSYTGSGGDVVIPGTIEGLPVTRIGSNAFYRCDGLTGVSIPDSVTSIGIAFVSCHNLIRIDISANVTSIGDGNNAFLDCQSLTGIYVSPDNQHYMSEDGVLFDKEKTKLISYPGGKSGAYSIPESVTHIGRNSFGSCHNLSSVYIPTSVYVVEDQAFVYCRSLTCFVVSPDNTNYSSEGGLLFNKNKTELVYCPGSTTGNFIIPSNVVRNS